MNRKLLGAAAFSAALAAGAGAGALLGVPVTSVAQESEDPDQGTDDEPTAVEVHATGGPRGVRRGLADLDVAAEALGVTKEELREALADGSSIADVAEDEGVDVQTVIDALVADATARLEELQAELPEVIGDLVEREGLGRRGFGPGGPGHHHRHRHGFGIAVLDVAAEALGVTKEELRDALADGSSIADVAEDEGVDVQTVIDALVADATARIDEKVADGEIDSEDAAELKAGLAERVGNLVEREGFGPRRFGPR